MLCDRQILCTCIKQWFGSISEFESQVANAVGESLISQLGSFLGYRRSVMVLIPLSWLTMDLYFAQFRRRLTDPDRRWLEKHNILSAGILELFRGLALWLGVGPFLLFLAVKMGHVFQKPRSSRILDCLLNVCIVVGIAGILVAILQIEPMYWTACKSMGIEHDILEVGSFFFALTMIILSLCGFHCCLPRMVPVTDEDTMPADEDTMQADEDTMPADEDTMLAMEHVSDFTDDSRDSVIAETLGKVQTGDLPGSQAPRASKLTI